MSQETEVAFNLVEIKDPATCNRVSFRFGEFNEVRARRQVGAARVYIDQYDGQGEFWLWMNASDVEENIKEFWEEQGLLDARNAYKNFKG